MSVTRGLLGHHDVRVSSLARRFAWNQLVHPTGCGPSLRLRTDSPTGDRPSRLALFPWFDDSATYPGSMSVEIGQQLGQYLIQEKIGAGGMGTVYRALDTSLEKTVAIKIVNPSLVSDDGFMRRFQMEAKSLGRAEHRNIVSVYALSQEGDDCFLVMEFVDGETLSERIRSKGPMEWQTAIPLFRQLLSGLGHLHKKKVLHRDIKPGNVMIGMDDSGDPIVKLLDFGVAKIQRDTESAVTVGTAGTLRYMSPEHIAGLETVVPQSDIFSLGLTLYETLSGQLPFDREASAYTISKTIMEGHLVDIGSVVELPRNLSRIVMKSLHRDLSRRYQSAEEMLADLTTFERLERDPDAGQIEHPARARKARASRIPWMITGALLLAGLAAGGYWLKQTQDEPTRPPEALVSASLDNVPAERMAIPEGSPPEVDESIIAESERRPEVAIDVPDLPSLSEETQPSAVAPVEVAKNQPVSEPKTAPPLRNGTLQVKINPWGDIFIDGELAKAESSSKFPFELSAGEHELRIVNTARDTTITQIVNITPDSIVDLSFDLRERRSVVFAAIEADGSPVDSNLLIDLSLVAVSGQAIPVAIGNHIVGLPSAPNQSMAVDVSACPGATVSGKRFAIGKDDAPCTVKVIVDEG